MDVDITDYIQQEAGSTADVIWGHGYDESLGDKLCVTIIATGFQKVKYRFAIKEKPKKVMDLNDEDYPAIITEKIAHL